jgi:uncharacterized protein YukE
MQVEPAELQHGATMYGQDYDAINSTLEALAAVSISPEDFGDVGAAHDRFSQAWLQETGVLLAAVGEVIAELLHASQTYQATDGESVKLFDSFNSNDLIS